MTHGQQSVKYSTNVTGTTKLKRVRHVELRVRTDTLGMNAKFWLENIYGEEKFCKIYNFS
jgi:hypothetical protein